MSIKKSFNYRGLMLLGIFISINSNSYAQSQEKNLDIYGGLGYTKLSDFSFNRTKKLFNEFSGVNLGVSGLYTLSNRSFFKPVLGAGLSSTSTYHTESSTGNPDISSIETTFKYTSITANGGVKFYPLNSFMIYGLANLGYSISNSLDADFKSSNSFINYVNSYTSFKIKNHYFYGATLMGTYKFGPMFSLGGSFTYNRHTMNLDYITRPETVNEKSSFNEYSTNLIAMWSF
jgi:hypothetical protein